MKTSGLTMATTTERLTLTEFERQYGHEKPWYEYWRGEAVQKSMPTWIHGLLQAILSELLTRAGLVPGSEVRLKIDLDLQLVPDLIATRRAIESAYPVSGVEVAVEILSEGDSMSRMLAKCEAYQRWGFEQIYVIDPVTRTVFRWLGNRLEKVDELAGFAAGDIWLALDARLTH